MKARFLFFCVVIFGITTLAQASDIEIRQPSRSYGQLIHVPAYSFVYSYVKGHQFNLAVTLSIRNTDLANDILIESVKYYDIDGLLIKECQIQPFRIKPGACSQYIINESDPRGGSGPSFRVIWRAKTAVFQPLVETVMIGTKSQQGISFTCQGRILEEFIPAEPNPAAPAKH